ncbi:UNVERIFIED_CONTAM: hypothetical protein FKN15_026357 [Acipenser sinensis]
MAEQNHGGYQSSACLGSCRSHSAIEWFSLLFPEKKRRFFDDVGQCPTLERIGIIAMSDQQSSVPTQQGIKQGLSVYLVVSLGGENLHSEELRALPVTLSAIPKLAESFLKGV